MQALKTYAQEYGIPLTQEMLEQFTRYASMLVEWNQRMNLTTITDEEGIVIKHFLDSLLVMKAVEPKQGVSLIDVGTGAGFPGVPLKIGRPDLQLLLLDSLQKRVGFLTELSTALGQQNKVLHGRAEECGRKSELREQFDFATARAVASLPALCEYCLPFVKIGGTFVALKGYDIEQEAQQSQRAIHELGGELADIQKFILPQENRRAIVVIKKISHTPPKYPRIAVKITKSPL